MSKQEYIEKNRQWLEDKRNEEGVSMLDRGVMYKVIKSGDKSMPSPKASSVVTVHYVGKTINGKTFDSSRGGVAPAFRLRDLIEGWTIALCRMHPGDMW
ncbi:MAG: FKBP-type peptidyl-prolyl cis-trans isomerase, partial [Muribaculaceae bacterium]|nr:FKBP-type peptidyl-prolyl cis-trans isomerase [Muribaculaceae bacterium]